LGEKASVDVARRFLAAARNTFESLAKMPEMAPAGRIRSGKFAGVRLWPVSGFEKYLIAYHPLKDGVQIDRVFHSALDYHRVLK
jgi:plasmid stabilization system protein ParE